MEKITLRKPDGSSVDTELHTSLSHGIVLLYPEIPLSMLAGARVNGEIHGLSSWLDCSSTLEPVGLDSPEGMQIRRRSLCVLLAAAGEEVFPGRPLRIAHAMGSGFYYHVPGQSLSQGEIVELETRFNQLIDHGAGFILRPVSWTDAVEEFTRRSRPDTVLLLEDHHESRIMTWRVGSYLDLDHGPLVQDASCLPRWVLKPLDRGFFFGPRESPDPSAWTSIHRCYQEYEGWGRVLGISSVGQLNQVSRSHGLKDFIWTAEALHQQKIAELAHDIAARPVKPRIVLIAGPSSSGKTTFAKKLGIQLRVMGFSPLALSLDDYFVRRDLTPRDEKGDYDFESLQALDIPLLNAQLLEFFEGREVDVPSFDFKLGDRVFGKKPMRLGEGGILIIEGIHGLNDDLTPLVDRSLKYKIFVSALMQLNIDRANRIATTDNRLIRRMVRDHRYRGYSARDTLERWPSVRRGEDRNIFPFQESSDAVFNSSLDYELGVLKSYAASLLKTVCPDSPLYAEARRILQFLDNFLTIPSELVPNNSILREFIGGSAFKY